MVVVTEEDVEQAMRLARWFRARKTNAIDLSDMESAALEGLAKAAKRFDGHAADRKGFWRYAVKCVIGEMHDDLRRLDHLRRPDRPLVETDEDGISSVAGASWINPVAPSSLDADPFRRDLIQDGRDAYAEADARSDLLAALRELDPRERDALLSVDYYGVVQRRVAERLGVSEGRVSQIRSAATAKVRAKLGADFRLAA